MAPPPSADLATRLAEIRETFPPRRGYLLGISGGRDSVVLLDVLHRLGYRKLTLCHLNHRLRGSASAADARFVSRLGDAHGLRVETDAVNVRAFAKARRLSLEAAARQARMEFFASVGAKTRCRRLFLAHHADDQVETVLMHLFRGSGGSGLAGMRLASQQAVGRRKLELLRPMLAIWREEIDAYVADRGLRYRDDASNESRAFLRNSVRHDLVPQLRKLFRRDIRKGVLRFAKIADAEEAWMERLAEEFDVWSTPEETLSVRKLRKVPLAGQRRVLRSWLRSRGVPDLGFEEVESVRALIAPNARCAKVNLPADHHVRRRSGVLFIEQPDPRK